MNVDLAIRSRRSSKQFSGVALPRTEVDALLELASWAPTHRMTQPWRFTCLDQAALGRLATWLPQQADIVAFPDPAKGAAKLAKLTSMLSGLGAMVVVTWVRATDPVVDLEDHAAASAAVQNLLLAATARGLGSFWSTNQALAHHRTLAHLGCGPDEACLGAIWLGTAAAPAPTPARLPLADRRRWCDG